MRYLRFFFTLQLLLIFLCQSGYAVTACWTWDNNTFYTYQFKTATYPGWGDTMYPYFNNAPTVYQGTYSNTPSCGQVNPSQATWTQGGGTCFVQFGSTFMQGNLGTLNLSNSSFTPCAPTMPVPLDDFVWPVMLGFAVFGYYNLKAKQNSGIATGA